MNIEINQQNIIIEISQQELTVEIANQTGIPLGGLSGQYLRKLSDTNYHVGWVSGTSQYYTHNQTTEKTEWIVNHNLGRYPSISVLSVGAVEVLCEIVHVSTNQARIYFNQPYKGLAQCI